MNIRGKIIITLFVALILHQVAPASVQKGRNAGWPKAQAAGEEYWDDRFYSVGAWGTVHATAVSGGALYVGGWFTTIGNIVANNIAKWDGTSWSALGTGMNSYVSALAVSGTDVYAGGWFTTAGGVTVNNIAKWNGTSWSALGTGLGMGMNYYISALGVSGTDVYAGGWFTTAGGVTVNNIAKWDGSSWSALGTGMDNAVNALAVIGTDVYAGGRFTTAGGVRVNNIAKWDGSSWSALGLGISAVGFSPVSVLAVSGTDVYAGGDIITAGGVAANYIAKWDGTSWSALGTGMNNSVCSLAVIGTDVYAGGRFTTAGGVTVNNIAKWNGSSWSALGSGMNSGSLTLALGGTGVLALTVSGTDVYAGGYFTIAGGVMVNNIAKWDGSGWSPLGSGRSGIAFTYNFGVAALAVAGTDIYAGGQFDTAGGVTVNNIAKWDGTGWSPLGSGISDADVFSSGVFALAVSGTDAYAGGKFTTAGGATVNNIAKWNGTNWSALGTGMDSQVRALAVIGTDVYAGGWFTTAGGVPVNHIAKWDGSSWSALGTGTNGLVSALAVIGTDVYAGGDFTTAGGVAVNCIAKWDGTSWSTLGMGMNSSVNALAVSGPDLYAGGGFTTAGGVTVNSIAKWNGTSWSPLGSGINDAYAYAGGGVFALTVSGRYVYAGGYFHLAGGAPANFIAKWDGKAWSALGSGMDNGVKALAVNGAGIYCGGWFGAAGDKVSSYFAIWHSNNLVLTSPNGGEIWETGSIHQITWLSPSSVGDVKIEYSTDGGGSWTTIAASTPNHGSYDWLVPGVNSTSALVRVSDAADGDPADASDAVFSIVTQPTIVVKSPNGGERWIRGSSHNIIWLSTLDVGNVKIEYSTDGGTSYAVIIASTPGTGRFLWTVPNSISATCLVRISSAAGGSPSDVSDAVFAISPGPVIRLSRANLTFGATTQGLTTLGQSVIVGNTGGGGTLNWTATSNKSWLRVSPQSGLGTGTIWVYVDASGLSAGAQTGTITVSDPNATNSPQTINVALTVKNSSLAPFGEFSTPLEGATGITGAIPVTGWALDDVGMAKVEIKRDPYAGDPVGAIGLDGLVFIGNAIFVEGARLDIETGYPDYPLNYKAGWGYMLLTNFLPNQGNGTYKLYAYAYDTEYYYTEGHKVLLGSKTITCSNATAVKPFGTIDTPAQGGDASGSTFVNFGWVLTPMPKTVAKDGTAIDVYMDSVKVGNLATAPNVYNQYRVDVATAFPGLNNSGGPVGAFYLDTTKYANGVHTIHWIATDDQSAADGIGSRYFNIVNTGSTAQAGSQAINLGNADSYESVMNLPVSFEQRKINKGFNLKAEPEVIQPDNYGTLRYDIREVERIEVDLGKGRGYRGYLVFYEELRSLPIGSTLDQRNGTFSWMPGSGFIGTYDLLFLQTDELGITRRIPIKLTIKPKFDRN